VVSAAFSPDVQRILTASKDATARLCDGAHGGGNRVASITASTASARLAQYSDQKVTAGQSAASQAVAQSAKSAMRGEHGHTIDN
jgi:hypothetical protein